MQHAVTFEGNLKQCRRLYPKKFMNDAMVRMFLSFRVKCSMNKVIADTQFISHHKCLQNEQYDVLQI